jgi:hypothetical protein
MLPALRNRPCPSCETRRDRPEICATRPAEGMDMDALRPSWSGLAQGKPFFTYHRCVTCGLLFNPVYFDAGQLDELYAAMAPNMDSVDPRSIAATQAGYYRAAEARGLIDGGYLEIGPDVGHIVDAAAESGRFNRFWLFEPNRAVHGALRSATRERETTILPDLADLAMVPDRSVTLAVMIHVLDHLLDPLETMATIRRKLHRQGVLLVVTHNESSLLRHTLGRRWPPFCLQHPQLFSPTTITELLARAGFGAITVTRSVNHFPIDFLGTQALRALGLGQGNLARILPRRSVALGLGNILTLAGSPRWRMTYAKAGSARSI